MASRRPSPRIWLPGSRAILVLALLGCLGFGAIRAEHLAPPPAYRTVWVRPGDTLWGIASARYPSQDPRAEVDEIERVNGLGGPAIRPGEALRVPAG